MVKWHHSCFGSMSFGFDSDKARGGKQLKEQKLGLGPGTHLFTARNKEIWL